MELFAKLYSSLLVFVYHCFDRIVIHGYLSGLSRPEQVVYFFHEVLGMPVVNKEVLSRRTNDYRSWVEAYARNHQHPHSMGRKGSPERGSSPTRAAPSGEAAKAYGVYFIFKSMEQGRTFRISVPKYPTPGPQLSHPGAPAEPLHPLLLLYPGPGSGTHHPARSEFLSLSCHLLAQRPFLHGTGVEPKADRLP